jgi:hypothetical protein
VWVSDQGLELGGPRDWSEDGAGLGAVGGCRHTASRSEALGCFDVPSFDGPEWRIKHTTDHGQRADIVVAVVGLQYAGGHAELEIIIDCPDTPIITPAEARKLARALIAAADSAEGGR